MKTYWVYIMSNKPRRLYVGFTSNLVKRVFQHKNKLCPESFTARYQFDMLVWYEPYSHVIRAWFSKESCGKSRSKVAAGKEADTDSRRKS
jgi:predicted GIY-YIG superfamily endonuclease